MSEAKLGSEDWNLEDLDLPEDAEDQAEDLVCDTFYSILSAHNRGEYTKGELFVWIICNMSPDTVDRFVAQTPDKLRSELIEWMESVNGGHDMVTGQGTVTLSPIAKKAVKQFIQDHHAAEAVRGDIKHVIEMKQREDPQPKPIANEKPPVISLVRAELDKREAIGLARYGVRLQPFNGRSFTQDACDESFDLAIYLRGLLEEEKWRKAKIDEAVKLCNEIKSYVWEPDYIQDAQESIGRLKKTLIQIQQNTGE